MLVPLPLVADMLEMTAECGNSPDSTSASRKVGVSSAGRCEVCCAVSPTPFPPLQAATIRVTDEERRMLEAEGVYLPHDMPLTKVGEGPVPSNAVVLHRSPSTQAEEKNLKRVRRKIKNRQSAYDSRRRKKEYVDGLEERVERSSEANRALQQKVGRLQEQNRMLIGQLRRLQKMVAQYNPSALQAGACMMVSVCKG